MLIATGASRVDRLVVSRGVSPRRRKVLRTYARAAGVTLVEAPLKGGRTDLTGANVAEAAGVVVQQPNFLGVVEDLADLRRQVPEKGHLVVAADPVALGLLKAPGECGADVVVGDGLGAGLNLNAGGPGVGFMAVTNKLMRRIPGRVVGRTKDLDGKPAFVLTLQAREQHIRRAQASSNICSNQALCALAMTVYLSTLGKTGLRALAEVEFHRAHAARRKLLAAGCRAPFEAPFFNEFPVVPQEGAGALNARLLKAGIVGGLDLSADYPELGSALLVAVTEKRSMEDVELLARKVGERHG
jgi:glycine dehydrogenase subunit 1